MSELAEIKGIGRSTLEKLNKAKIKNLKDLANSTSEYLSKIEGIGIKSAIKWINAAKAKLKITPSYSKPKSSSTISSYSSTMVSESEIDFNHSSILGIRSDIKQIFKRLDNIESRLDQIQNQNSYLPKSNVRLKNTTKIKDVNLFSNIVREAIEEITTGRFGINKISLEELFNSINKNYYITKERFTKYLLDLHSRNKIQLEPGLIDQDFYIKDNYGNIYKIIRILE